MQEDLVPLPVAFDVAGNGGLGVVGQVRAVQQYWLVSAAEALFGDASREKPVVGRFYLEARDLRTDACGLVRRIQGSVVRFVVGAVEFDDGSELDLRDDQLLAAYR